MTSPAQNNKKYLNVVLFIALLLAGLFYFLRPRFASEFAANQQEKPLKPSQMTFADSNKFREPELNSTDSTAALQQNAGQPTDSVVEAELRPEDQKKIEILNEILKSKNDNDPRINNELKSLNAEVHRALMAKYNRLAPEDRNGRGTIVFLIARDLKSTADLDFIEKVYQEPPCLSLADCGKASTEEGDHLGADQTTTNYPQLVALYQLDQQLGRQPELLSDPAFRSRFVAVLKEADGFAVPAVNQRAQQIRKKYGL